VASQLSRAAAPVPAPAPGPAFPPDWADGVASAASVSASPATDAGLSVDAPALTGAAAAGGGGGGDGAAGDGALGAAPAAGAPAAPAAQRAAVAVLRAATDTYSLSVVRLADPAHATVAEVNVTAGRRTYRVCSDAPRPVLAPAAAPAAAAPGAGGGGTAGAAATGGAAGGWAAAAAPRCAPDAPMWLNVSHGVEWVALHPRLAFPGIPGLRVEAGGQVLSQGGDVGADQVEDTTALTPARRAAAAAAPCGPMLERACPCCLAPLVWSARGGVRRGSRSGATKTALRSRSSGCCHRESGLVGDERGAVATNPVLPAPAPHRLPAGEEDRGRLDAEQPCKLCTPTHVHLLRGQNQQGAAPQNPGAACAGSTRTSCRSRLCWAWCRGGRPRCRLWSWPRTA
jgi:hypothetical protein